MCTFSPLFLFFFFKASKTDTVSMFQVVTRRIPQYCAKVLGLCTPSWAKFMGGQQKRLKKAAQFPLQHLVGGSSLYPRSLTVFFFVCLLFVAVPGFSCSDRAKGKCNKNAPPKTALFKFVKYVLLVQLHTYVHKYNFKGFRNN